MEAVTLRQARLIKDMQQQIASIRSQMEPLSQKEHFKPLDAYPVGTVYISVLQTSPQELFGGTWEAYGQGRVLAGKKDDDPDFNTPGHTGGAKSAVMTQAQLVGHEHQIEWYQGQLVSLSGNGEGSTENGYRTGYSSGTVRSVSLRARTNTSIPPDPIPIFPPFVVVNIWRRTA